MGTLQAPVSRSRRPPRPARGRMIRFRVSDEEYATLAEKSAAVGDMSKFLRDHLGKAQIRHREDERRRLAMLNRINANLNMISRWVNTPGFSDTWLQRTVTGISRRYSMKALHTQRVVNTRPAL
jgi:hypothetical protein